MQNVKMVTVGDGTVGKTSLLMSYTENRFPVDYVPTIFDNFTTGVEVDGRLISFALWDTAGQEEYARLRSLSYPETDVFLICFSVTSQASLENVRTKWATELNHCCPGAKKILCGTKLDLRPTSSSYSFGKPEELKGYVTTEMGRKVAEEIGAAGYFECSALTQQGVAAVFEGAIRAVPSPSKRSRTRRSETASSSKREPKKQRCRFLLFISFGLVTFTYLNILQL